MESLNGQVARLEREKAKKEESVANRSPSRRLASGDSSKRLSGGRRRRRKQAARKFDENRCFKFKQAASKDLIQEKKKIAEKDKVLAMKGDYKKWINLLSKPLQL